MGLEEISLNVIREHRDGIFQNELWKEMDIDSRKCSRIVTKLVTDGLVTRESAVSNGARTYLLKIAEEEKSPFDLLLVGDMFSPCAGCRDACQPEYCGRIAEWILHLMEIEESA